jgi:hypothetical protein
MAGWRRRQNKTKRPPPSNEFHPSDTRAHQNRRGTLNFAVIGREMSSAPNVFTRKSGCCVCSSSSICEHVLCVCALYWLLARSFARRQMKCTQWSRQLHLPDTKWVSEGEASNERIQTHFAGCFHPEFGKTAKSAEMKWGGSRKRLIELLLGVYLEIFGETLSAIEGNLFHRNYDKFHLTTR